MLKKIKDLTLQDCINICKNHCESYGECSQQCKLYKFCISTNWDITDIKEFRNSVEVEVDE